MLCVHVVITTRPLHGKIPEGLFGWEEILSTPTIILVPLCLLIRNLQCIKHFHSKIVVPTSLLILCHCLKVGRRHSRQKVNHTMSTTKIVPQVGFIHHYPNTIIHTRSQVSLEAWGSRCTQDMLKELWVQCHKEEYLMKLIASKNCYNNNSINPMSWKLTVHLLVSTMILICLATITFVKRLMILGWE